MGFYKSYKQLGGVVMGKNLGIIGKGDIIQHFFANLRESAVHQDARYNSEAFFSEIDKVLFYSDPKRYKNAADYERSGGYQAVHKILGKKVDVADNFTDFFRNSDVVVDITQGYTPGKVGRKFPDQEQKKGSLLEYIQQLRKGEEKVRAGNAQWTKEDFKEYVREEQGKILMTESEFQTHWEDSKRIAEAIIGLKESGYAFGPRTEMAFPFSVGMIKERGEEIFNCLYYQPEDSSKKPIPRDVHPHIPTYINVVNEPCSSSNLLVGKCPELAPYVIACAGYDLERITEQINQDDGVRAEIKAARKNGMKVPEDFRIQLAYAWGAHDAHLIVPVFSAAGEHKDEAENILCRFNESFLYPTVKDAVGRYLKSTLESGGDINAEVDRCLLKTIICAARSRGKAFSVYPAMEEQPLCNGYFQQSVGENTGMFLMGAHRFRNGKVVEGR